MNSGRGSPRQRLMEWQDQHRAVAGMVLSVTPTVVAAGWGGGWVAAVVVGAYAALGCTLWSVGAAERLRASARASSIEQIEGLAAQLRAGLSPQVDTGRLDPTARERVGLACHLSERLGTPLASLLELVGSDLRAAEQLRRTVAANTAGAKATMFLLAALPIGGIALGVGAGSDPLHYLLRTGPGAGCALAALLMQISGLLWFAWLLRRAKAEWC